MKKHREDYQGIYQELVELIGEEMTQKFYQYYKGQQITFPGSNVFEGICAELFI